MKHFSKTETRSAEELLRELDRDSKSRDLTGIYLKIYQIFLVAFSVYVIVSALLLKSQSEYTKLPLFVGFSLFIGYLKFPACKRDALKTNYIPWYDMILALLSLAVYSYYPVVQGRIIRSAPLIDTLPTILGLVGILLLVELCRRAVGLPLIVVAGIFVSYEVYTLFSRNPATVLTRLSYDLFYNIESGVFSTPISVCCGFIVIFIIFGSLLEKTGIGAFFVDLANSVAGASAGGPAKVAVISSALGGMYSGSSVANTVESGTFTIPMMKKTGYKPEFAAAVEAAASTGGQIMPPIMGAAAFLMAQITGYSYATIAVAAILPAFLYFAGIFIMVHFAAKRNGLRGLPKESLPNFFRLLAKKGYLLAPILVLVACMSQFTPAMAACYAILCAFCVSMLDEHFLSHLRSGKEELVLEALRGVLLCVIPLAVYFGLGLIPAVQKGTALFCALAVSVACSAFTKDAPLTPKNCAEGFMGGTNSAVGVAVACGMAGIISGVVASTGLGSTLITLIVPIAEKSIFLALLLTMLCCIVLGMGVPTTANYVIMATITAPILVRSGVNLLAAHMFVFYFGIVADITPPVALAAYAGSAIAKSSPLKTGIVATKLAIAAFVVPYIFVMNPAMLFVETTVLEVIQIVVTSCFGIFGVAAGMEGYVLRPAGWLERLLLLVGGLVLIIPGTLTDVIGIILIGLVIAYQILLKKKEKKATA